MLTVGGGYVPFTEPLDEIVKLAHGVGVPVYPTISASGMRGPEGRYNAVETWRGAAANMWHAGVDGIVTFNIFPAVGRNEPAFRASRVAPDAKSVADVTHVEVVAQYQ